MEKQFNLIDQPWLPIADVGRVSLRQVFSQPHYRAVGGNPVQKIALMKLLLAIAQAAYTPADENAWQALGAEGLAQRCLAYLDKWHDRFDLYGDKPFLQMPVVKELLRARTESRLKAAKTAGKKQEAEESGQPKSMGAGFYPDIPSENNTQLSATLFDREMDNADKAIFITTLMNFAFAGKRVESDLINLSGEKLGNRYSAPAAPSIGGWDGQLHCFVLAPSLIESIWLNLVTLENLSQYAYWPSGLGKPIWEETPTSESDAIAKRHKESYQASLIALSRFAFLLEDGLLYLDGIQYPKVKEGWGESSLLINRADIRDIKVQYVDVNKKPWRSLPSLLAFNTENSSSGHECIGLKISLPRCRGNFETISIWCGGLKVAANSGDQSVKQDDDFVASQVDLYVDQLGGFFFTNLLEEMKLLEQFEKSLAGCTVAYYKELTGKNTKPPQIASDTANRAKLHYWQLCERDFQDLLDHCDHGEENRAARRRLRQHFANYVQQAYDRYCPQDTARQLDAWAQCRPKLGKYLKQED
jgi:CRISPR system Cascade subunit CasA